MDEISSASIEQRQAIEQINAAVALLDGATQANAASAEQSAASSHDLDADAAAMRESVAELVSHTFGRADGI